MSFSLRKSVALLVFVLGVAMYFWLESRPTIPRHVYLTWSGDTSTTMTVNFQVRNPEGPGVVKYDLDQEDDYQWEVASTNGTELFDTEGPTSIYHIELVDLKPGQTYYFRAGDATGMSEEFRFSTLPEQGSVRFVTGGDMGRFRETVKLLDQAAATDPMFAVVGGDLAYANGNLESDYLWHDWMDNWSDEMRRSDGSLIPIVAAVGNHDVRRTGESLVEKGPFFFRYFQQFETSYGLMTFSDTLALFLLDSGHVAPHDGEQAGWLEEALQNSSNFPHRMAVYHVPLYPSHRPFEGKSSVAGRLHWQPLFEAHGVNLAFENHDHALKRTHPLKGGEIVAPGEGVVYLGDGCWGLGPRSVEPRRWYEAHAESTRHFWAVEVDEQGANCRAIGQNGEILDQVHVPLRDEN